jgi:Skp family chaperone for outer membrane proteins
LKTTLFSQAEPCREIVRLEERCATLATASEAELKEAQAALAKAQEELAAMLEKHEKTMTDAAAAREASVATVRAERNSALKELKQQHAAKIAQAEVLSLLISPIFTYVHAIT